MYSHNCHKQNKYGDTKMKLKIRKRKQKMSLLSKLVYELIPTNDQTILLVDRDIAKL